MAEQNKDTVAEPAKQPKKMTAAEAAKLVRRMVPKLNDKGEIIRDKELNPISVPQAIKESDVMSFAEYEDRVVVVTTHGEKLVAEKAEK